MIDFINVGETERDKNKISEEADAEEIIVFDMKQIESRQRPGRGGAHSLVKRNRGIVKAFKNPSSLFNQNRILI